MIRKMECECEQFPSLLKVHFLITKRVVVLSPVLDLVTLKSQTLDQQSDFTNRRKSLLALNYIQISRGDKISRWLRRVRLPIASHTKADWRRRSMLHFCRCRCSLHVAWFRRCRLRQRYLAGYKRSQKRVAMKLMTYRNVRRHCRHSTSAEAVR